LSTAPRRFTSIASLQPSSAFNEAVCYSIMPLPAQLATELAHGAAYSFSDWPNSAVPTFGAGVYTIWHRDGRFIYVGMSGRGITADTLHRNTPQGIYTRLQSPGGAVAISSVFMWLTVSSCPRYLMRTRRYCLWASPDGCLRAPVHS
jgi:hypothetical protein